MINFKEKINEVDNSADCEILAARRRCEDLDYQSKIIFKKAYEKALQTGEPFLIGIKIPQECHACDGGQCLTGSKNVKTDLTKGFPVITEEPPSPGDTGIKLAIISKEGRKIYIESKQSFQIRGEDNKSCGDEIIEVNIYSSPSLDFFLKELREPELFNIRHFFHNFKPKTIKVNDPKNCTKAVTSFIVFSSGKATIEKSSYFDFNNTKDPKKIYSKLIENTDQEYYKMFIAEVEAAFRGGVRIKNCYLCRYHAGAKNFDSGQKGGIFCKVKKETNGSNKAADCECYRPDAKVLGTERYPSYRNWW